MKKQKLILKILVSFYHYFCFFLLMAFVISCCMVLFLNIMSDSMDITFTEANINTAAIVTFWNEVFLSFVLVCFINPFGITRCQAIIFALALYQIH